MWGQEEMHVEIERSQQGVIALMVKILPLCRASLPEPAGSFFSPKYQLWNFAAHKAAFLPGEGNLSAGQLAPQCCWPCRGRHKHTSGAQGAAPADSN